VRLRWRLIGRALPGLLKVCLLGSRLQHLLVMNRQISLLVTLLVATKNVKMEAAR
jgi:hypothetical protein